MPPLFPYRHPFMDKSMRKKEEIDSEILKSVGTKSKIESDTRIHGGHVEWKNMWVNHSVELLRVHITLPKERKDPFLKMILKLPQAIFGNYGHIAKITRLIFKIPYPTFQLYLSTSYCNVKTRTYTIFQIKYKQMSPKVSVNDSLPEHLKYSDTIHVCTSTLHYRTAKPKHIWPWRNINHISPIWY